jgi:acyl carrier protein
MSNEEILPVLAEIIEDIAGVDAADVTPEKSFLDDLDIDSLSMVEIVVQAEDTFDMKVADELAEFQTVGDALSYISASRAERTNLDEEMSR